jgi:hypothetical protein
MQERKARPIGAMAGNNYEKKKRLQEVLSYKQLVCV